MEHKIIIGLVVQVGSPCRRAALVEEIHEDDGVLEKRRRQHQQRKTENARAHAAGLAQRKEVIEIHQPHHHRV